MKLICFAKKLIRIFLININYTYFLAYFSILAWIEKVSRLVFLLRHQEVSHSYSMWAVTRWVYIHYVYLIFTNILDPWAMQGLGMWTLPTIKTLPIIYSRPSASMVSWFLWFHIWWFNQPQIV